MPRDNFWFADMTTADVDGSDHDPQCPWRPCLQIPGMVDWLSTRFPTKEACEEYMRLHILGASLDNP